MIFFNFFRYKLCVIVLLNLSCGEQDDSFYNLDKKAKIAISHGCDPSIEEFSDLRGCVTKSGFYGLSEKINQCPKGTFSDPDSPNLSYCTKVLSFPEQKSWVLSQGFLNFENSMYWNYSDYGDIVFVDSKENSSKINNLENNEPIQIRKVSYENKENLSLDVGQNFSITSFGEFYNAVIKKSKNYPSKERGYSHTVDIVIDILDSSFALDKNMGSYSWEIRRRCPQGSFFVGNDASKKIAFNPDECSFKCHESYLANGGIDAQNCNFSGKNFSYFYLRNVNFVQSNLNDSKFIGTDLKNAILKDANLKNASFDNAYLENADLSGANLENTSFIGISGKLKSCLNTNLDLPWTCFDGYILGPKVNHKYSSVKWASNLDLREANFMASFLQNADFSESNLEDANFSAADLTGARFDKSNLKNAIFIGANLLGTSFFEANLEGACLEGAVGFKKGKGGYFGEPKLNNCKEDNIKNQSYKNCDSKNWKMHLPNLSHCNLLGADLSSFDFKDVDFSYSNLDRVDFSASNLFGADLSESSLNFVFGKLKSCPEENKLPIGWACSYETNHYLIGAGANLWQADLESLDLSNKDLSKTNFSFANLASCQLSNTNLSQSFFHSSNFFEADMYAVNLTKSYLENSYLNVFDLKNSVLDGVYGDLKSCPSASQKLPKDYICKTYRLIGPKVNLTLANLSGLDLSYMDLKDINFSNANLSRASMKGSDLRGAVFSGSDLNRSCLEDSIGFDISKKEHKGSPNTIPCD